MISHERRLKVLSVVVKGHSIRSVLWFGLVRAICSSASGLVRVSSARRSRATEVLTLTSKSLIQRCDALLPKLRHIKQLPLKERADLMAARRQLLEDYDDMKAMAERLRQRQPIASLALPALHWLSASCIRWQRRNDSLLRIVSKPDSDTLYGDLLLWTIMPHSFSEGALGDLNEEFELRASTDRSAARAWYRSQVWSTLKSCIWRRIERLVAIATLIELAFRSHKK